MDHHIVLQLASLMIHLCLSMPVYAVRLLGAIQSMEVDCKVFGQDFLKLDYYNDVIAYDRVRLHSRKFSLVIARRTHYFLVKILQYLFENLERIAN